MDLKKILEMIENDEISKDRPLMLDNDAIRLYGKDQEELLNIYPEDLLKQFLDLHNIPWEEE